MKKFLSVLSVAVFGLLIVSQNGFCNVQYMDYKDGEGGGNGGCGSGNAWIKVIHRYTTQPVSGAAVRLYDVQGRSVANLTTNACGYVFIDQYVPQYLGYQISKSGFDTLNGGQMFVTDTRIALNLTPSVWCGDGMCEPPEDAQNCPADCPQDPCAGVNCNDFDYNMSGCSAQCANECCSSCHNVNGQYSGCTNWQGQCHVLGNCR